MIEKKNQFFESLITFMLLILLPEKLTSKSSQRQINTPTVVLFSSLYSYTQRLWEDHCFYYDIFNCWFHRDAFMLINHFFLISSFQRDIADNVTETIYKVTKKKLHFFKSCSYANIQPYSKNEHHDFVVFFLKSLFF